MCGLLGNGSFFDVIGYPTLFAELYNLFGAFIIKPFMVRVSRNDLVIVQHAENDLVCERNRFQYLMEILLNHIRCRIRLDAYPSVASSIV